MKNPLHWVGALCILALTIALVVPLVTMWPVAGRVEVASRQLLECKSNPACLQSQMLATVGAVKAIAGTVAKSAPEITASVRAASVNSVSASRATAQTAQTANELLLEAKGAVVELHATLQELHGTVSSLTKDADALLKSSDITIQQAGQAFKKMGELEDTLRQQIESGAPEAQRTLRAMAVLLEDPSISGTLANMDDGTGHLAQMAETFDIATRGLREKVGRVKWVLNKIAGMIKITLPIF